VEFTHLSNKEFFVEFAHIKFNDIALFEFHKMLLFVDEFTAIYFYNINLWFQK